jgi:hypothetical protein
MNTAMPRSMPRLLFRLWALGLLLAASFAAPAQAAGWKAVLVAGDNAEPVFDNAVEAMNRWLQGIGVAASDIFRLSASARPLYSATEPASARLILGRVAALRPARGEGCLVFITSHGLRHQGIWLAATGEFLEPAALARALSAGCGRAPTVVIASACYSGAFTSMRAPNRIIITAARPDRPSFGCQADRTYTVFDECMLAALPQAATWRGAYKTNVACVRQRERELGVLPSQPQGFFGKAVRKLTVR